MGILTWIILGLIAGLLAKLIMPGDDPGGFIITILLGIAGTLVGGFLASALGLGAVAGVNLGSIVIAILGAVLLLLIYRLVVGRRSRSASGMPVSRRIEIASSLCSGGQIRWI